MNSTWRVRCAACGPVAIALAILVPAATSLAAGPPPPPVGAAGHTVQLVARGIASPTQIAVVHGHVFVAAAGDEKTGRGGGLWRISNGKASQVDPTPYYGLVFTHGRLFASGNNQIVSAAWADGGLAQPKVIFQRPRTMLPYIETMAVGPDGRLYMGSGDAADKGAIGAALSGRVFAINRDGSGFEELAKGLRQPFGIAFVQGDPAPYVGNESDEGKSNPPDFLVHAVKGSDFGFPRCQWASTTPGACAGKTKPALLFRPHASPTGLVGAGSTIYAAFFGGTTKKGPELRALKTDGSSTQLVKSALPLIGVGIASPWLYFGDISGSIYRVRV
jgi:glucose/arabinose dehydrogenase